MSMPATPSGRRPSATRVLTSLVALVTVLGASATGCGSDDTPAGSPTTSRASTSGAANGSGPSTVPTIPPYRTSIADVRNEVNAVTPLDAPAGTPVRLDTAGDGTRRDVSISNPLPSGAPTTFRVRTLGPVIDGVGWYEVYLPVRPNGSTGWLPDTQVTLTHTDLAITVDRTAHTLTLTDAGIDVVSYPVAVGLPDTPTPAGDYYLKELVEPRNGAGAYGPIAYGLSAHSPTLVDTEAFADGVIGIHGTDQPQLIGTDVSHGCIRMRNADILALRDHGLPLGTPVHIT